MLAAASPPSNWAMTALASMTSNALLQLSFALRARSPNQIRCRPEPLDRAAAADALLHLGERRSVGDPRQVAQDQLGHRDPLARGADLEGPVELIGNVAYLDHLHGQHMISCVMHVIKGRTRLFGAPA